MTRSRLRGSIVFVIAALAALPSFGGPVATPHVTAELLLDRAHVRPGEAFRLGLHLRMKEGWHTYWKHPGDSGEATTIDWALPDGFTAGPILWPQPQRIAMDPLTVYGYEGDVLLLVPMRAPATAVAGSTASIVAEVYWMVCEEICIPEEVTLDVEVPIAGERPSPGLSAALFARSAAALPIPSDGWGIRASMDGDRILLEARAPEGVRIEQPGIAFFAASGPLIEYGAPQPVSRRDGVLALELTRSPYATGDVRRLSGVLHAPGGWVPGGPVAVEIDTPIEGSPLSAPVIAERPPLTLWIALGLAFLGGVVLNLMPCVFPVVSLKILAFVRHSGDEPRRVRLHGLCFAGGVLLAFWILAGLLLALRAAGEEVGWGFQLQSPAFVAALAFLLFALALSLSGVMEVGTSLTRLGATAGRSGYGTSALDGMLATVVATPCTAPFMGAALGFALTQSATAALLIFTALGAGMAAPYVLLSLWPALLRSLPRPGHWMVRFKQLMAFPLFATVAWLVWVFGHQTGVDGVLRLLLGLTLAGAGAWVWGSWSTPGASTGVAATARSVAVALLAAGFVLSVGAQPVGTDGETTAASQSGGSGVRWEPWSPERVAELRAEGRPVFVNFTAAWCLTCKVNERVVFSSAEVRRVVDERNIAMLKADWTHRDAAITRALGAFGRSGVPMYVLYGSDPSASPRLLPEILGKGMLVETFSRYE